MTRLSDAQARRLAVILARAMERVNAPAGEAEALADSSDALVPVVNRGS